ncbi:hypothetical protein WA026_002497 [Henosepilachna vigintioctopunctata]|uniref:Endoplasmic reticulum lectin 1 n=1 Tax=Henosepilachna vigintioctopunctata TaxID=420089 RepID=A0AAW1U1A9_9CUCU
MYRVKILIFLFLFGKTVCVCNIENSNQIFDIKWAKFSETPKDQDNLETMKIASSLKENYSCVITKNTTDNFIDVPSYKGPTAIDIIQYLFNKGICSYRSEPYWTYELCHGKHIRQYHEIFDGPRLKFKQYNLGKMDPKEQEIVIEKLRGEELEMQKNSSFNLPFKKFDNKEMHYVEITMSDGSSCEFDKNKFRESKIYYICDIEANHDIHSIEEVVSCKYEVVISTPLLCMHPKYRPRKIPKSVITCYAIGKSPRIPYNLVKMYMDRDTKDKSFKSKELVKYEEKRKFELQNTMHVNSEAITDFLSGKNCISGGTGNWKYEFCYGKYINQYSYGRFGMKTTTCLGKFNLEKHIDWIKSNPHKRPKTVETRSHINQFYANGCVSNVTGRPRQTEVKLKCMENSSGNALVMYLYETNVGEYLLGIEAPILCHVIRLADENGLIPVKS